MSDHLARPFLDEEATSGACSQAHQSSWMSHWIKRGPMPVSVVNNSSLICYKNGDIDNKSCYGEGRLKIEDDFPKSGIQLGKEVDEMSDGMTNANFTKKTGDFLNKIGYSPFPALKYTENASTAKVQIDHEFGDRAMSLALSLGKGEIVKNFNALQKSHLRNSEKRGISYSYPGQKGSTDLRLSAYAEAGLTSHCPPHRSHHAAASGPLVVFERQFSNDNFTCIGQGHCKHQVVSAFLFHEKKMNNDLSLERRQSDGLQLQQETPTNENFPPFFLKKQSENIQGHPPRGFPTHKAPLNFDQKFCCGCEAADRVPQSVRNVETMRICTMVDSVENSPGGPPKISQRAQHFLFTKETCVNMSEAHQELRKPTFPAHHEEKTFVSPRPQGLKIQPLWTTTDSEERENTGNPSTCNMESRNESSAETEPMQIEAPEDQNTKSVPHSQFVTGSDPCPMSKDDAVDENVPPAAFNSRTEKARSKRPIAEIPDINEGILGLQPAVSSTDGTEPSTSRVHRLDAKQLFPCAEQTSRSELNVQKYCPPVLDATSRWIKRLKSSDSFGVGTKSSQMEESSSHEKFSLFFNKVMKCNKASLENMLSKHQGKDQMVLDQNMESPRNMESSFMVSNRKNQNTVLGCSWIQRWCRNSSTPPIRNPEPPLLICEPLSLKLGQDELSKKPFPGIAAMALMGKAMSGFRPCEFRKRGPVVFWNTNGH